MVNNMPILMGTGTEGGSGRGREYCVGGGSRCVFYEWLNETLAGYAA